MVLELPFSKPTHLQPPLLMDQFNSATNEFCNICRHFMQKYSCIKLFIYFYICFIYVQLYPEDDQDRSKHVGVMKPNLNKNKLTFLFILLTKHGRWTQQIIASFSRRYLNHNMEHSTTNIQHIKRERSSQFSFL